MNRFNKHPRLVVLSALASIALAMPASAEVNPLSEIDVCRPAGFWQTHAGSEKGAPNIVLELLDDGNTTSDDCLRICGEIIDETTVNSADSALEGLCISPKSGASIQLARQLIAATLSCLVATGDPNCLEGSEYCNDACADGETDADDELCQGYLECTTKGGAYGLDGSCATGTCSISGETCGSGYDACPDGETCVPFENSCALAPLVNEGLAIDYDPEPRASSSKACNAATKSKCTVVGPNEAECETGTESGGLEVCPDDSCAGMCLGQATSGCYCDVLSCVEDDGCLDRDIVCPTVCD